MTLLFIQRSFQKPEPRTQNIACVTLGEASWRGFLPIELFEKSRLEYGAMLCLFDYDGQVYTHVSISTASKPVGRYCSILEAEWQTGEG